MPVAAGAFCAHLRNGQDTCILLLQWQCEHKDYSADFSPSIDVSIFDLVKLSFGVCKPLVVKCKQLFRTKLAT